MIQRRSWFVLLPLAALCGYLIRDSILSGPGSASSAPVANDANELIAIWRAEVAGLDGTPLEIRLSPLHAEQEHARFDSETLRERFGLPEGEAWRLELIAASDSAPNGGFWPRIEDEGGVALVGFRSAQAEFRQEPSESEPVNPVATLFGADTGEAAPAGSSILWGRQPAGEVRLVLATKGPESGKMAPPLASYPLQRDEWPCDQLPRYVVRFDGDAGTDMNNPADD